MYRIKHPKTDTTIADTTDSETGLACPSYPLIKGSGMGTRVCEQPYVKIIQNYLNRNDLPILSLLTIDGKFGPKTESALKLIADKTTVSKDEYEMMKAFVTAAQEADAVSGDFWNNTAIFG
jgi:peptidoglycan hydrolase-like protein with peptidoglycan-binding domain